MNSSFLHVFLFSVLMLGFAAPAQAAPIRITAFGDSLVAGDRLDPADTFPAKLEAALKQAGYDVAVANAGVSGETSAQGLARLDAIVASRPEIVIVEFGTNDAFQGVPPAKLLENLNEMLARLRKERIRAVLAGVAAPMRDGAYAKGFNPVFRRAALENEAVLYPSFLDRVATDRALMQADGVHPNREGVEVIVEHFLPYLIPVVEDRQFAREMKRTKRQRNPRR